MRSERLLTVAFAVAICSAAIAQTGPTDQRAMCANYQAQIESLSLGIGQTPLWDDNQIARARSSLAKLQASRTNLVRLIRRLNSAEQSAGNAEAFDRSGEANVWRRDAEDLRQQIDTEKKRARAWAADAGVSCPGCTYTVVISKVESAVAGAIAARNAALQAQQQITSYRNNMSSYGCSR